MSTWILVMIMSNAQGHDIYRSPAKPFHDKVSCEIRAGQLQTHPSVKKAFCVEAYDVK